jgi:hypothetical protein
MKEKIGASEEQPDYKTTHKLFVIVLGGLDVALLDKPSDCTQKCS